MYSRVCSNLIYSPASHYHLNVLLLRSVLALFRPSSLKIHGFKPFFALLALSLASYSSSSLPPNFEIQMEPSCACALRRTVHVTYTGICKEILKSCQLVDMKFTIANLCPFESSVQEECKSSDRVWLGFWTWIPHHPAGKSYIDRCSVTLASSCV